MDDNIRYYKGKSGRIFVLRVENGRYYWREISSQKEHEEQEPEYYHAITQISKLEASIIKLGRKYNE